MSLSLTDITLTYPDGQQRLTALDHVSMVAEAGAVTAVIGPSGSGKSSLLAVAATLIAPDSGSVRLGDRELVGLGRAAATRIRREEIGIVFQQSNLLPSLTAVEQIQALAHVAGRRPSASRATATDLLSAVGLSGAVTRRRPHQLSGGERQRVNIARALINEPQVLLVDEPTSALDTDRGEAVLELLGRITREREVATVMVTHNLDHAAVADAVVRIVDGRVAEPVGRIVDGRVAEPVGR